MSISPRVINVDSQQSQELRGVIVARGELLSRSRLIVHGDLKLGKFFEVKDSSSISVFAEDNNTGGTMILAEGFSIPSSGTFRSEHSIQINKGKIPSRESIFDKIEFICSAIKAESMDVINNGQTSPASFYPKNPLEMQKIEVVRGSTLTLGDVAGPQGSISGFEYINTKSLRNFQASRGQGIIAGEVRTGDLSDVLIRAKKVVALRACGTLELTSYDIDPHPDGHDLPGADKGFDTIAWLTRSSEEMLDTHLQTSNVHTEDFDIILASKLAAEAADSEGLRSAKSDSKNPAAEYRDSYADLPGNDDYSEPEDEEAYSSKRIAVAIQNLYCVDKSNPTKVTVTNGDLSIGMIDSKGVQILLKNGVVIIDSTRTDTSQSGETVIIAPKIYFMRLPTDQSFRTMKLYGEVYVQGVRMLRYETQL